MSFTVLFAKTTISESGSTKEAIEEEDEKKGTNLNMYVLIKFDPKY